jgi:hypothetical protein
MSERCLPVEIGPQYFLFRLSDVISVQSRAETSIPVIDLSKLFWNTAIEQGGYVITIGPCAFLVNHIRPAIEVNPMPLPALITGPFRGVVRGGLVQLLILDCVRLLDLLNRVSPDQ